MRRRGAAALAAWFLTAACFAAGTAWAGDGTPPVRLPGYGPRVYGARPTVSQMTALGARLFAEPALSASGRQSCASCHSPAHAFAAPNRLPAQFGGPRLATAGKRNPPSLMYLQTTLPFTEHYIDDEDGHGIDAGPTGGFTWDGRVQTLHEQARVPLFAANEMANRSPAELAQRLKRSPLAEEFGRAFSPDEGDVFANPDEVVNWVVAALEVYQQDAATFYPFTSKFDAVLRGCAELTPAEARGLVVFNDEGRGNCASCHSSSRRSDGGLPLFTDGSYAALGVPRNPALAANRDARYFDMGLCGPERSDLSSERQYCGLFKTPSLRNVAKRESFFHNGRFHDLRDVIEFYATRDTQPARWYPRDAQHRVQRYDDLPRALRGNVNREAPFAPLPGGRARLAKSDIDDLLAFLRALNDGDAASAQCAAAPRSAARAD